MKAAVLENKRVLTYKDVPTPEPGPGHVRLKVKAISICGSDIKRYVDGHRMYPLVLGHENSGVIDRVGEGVSASYLGKHAAIIPLVPCFKCEQCRHGHYSACHNYSFIGSRQSGGFAEFVDLPEKNVFILPDNLSFEHAALIEPSTVARHMLALGGFQRGQTAIVLGAGSIGLMAVQWLRILGADLIIVTDILEDNLEIASKIGAHVTLNPSKVDVIKEVQKLTGDGADLTLEATGVPQVLEQTLPITRPRGRVVLAGNQPLDKSLPLTFIENMMRREISLIGCFMSYSAPFPGHEWTETIAALSNGSLDMEALISHHFPLSSAPEVFEKIGAHQLAHQKIILNPEETA
ncbi:MAG TPA: galactitol-1-phosphate 5-dehydrogenase [Anaerolineales bacterium]|nr:galactitol-1-phosphate 5-dehydrogenase [Anaerolineales bacterium]